MFTTQRRRRRGLSDQIRHLSLFRRCDDAGLDAVLSLCTELAMPAGHTVVRQGAHGNEFFVITEGVATVLVDERNIATLGPGDFFGEMALLRGAPRSATVRSKSPMKVLVFDPRQFSQLIESVPCVAQQLMRGLSDRLEAAQPHRAARTRLR